MSEPFSALGGAGPLRDQVYLALRHDLMSGALEPTERVGEERLAEVYGVSRTPVREALARLLADGLLQRNSSGLFPYRPRVDELAGLYELRVTLELRGITRVADSTTDEPLVHDRDVLGPLVDRWTALRSSPPPPDAGFVAADEQFHVTLLAASGNRALAGALETVNARIRPVRMFDYLTEDRMAATIDEHVRIAESVLSGDYTTSSDELLAHIDDSRLVVISRAAEALSMAKLARAVRA